MHISKVKLNHFRNYNDLEISFSEGCNVICGRNAQGKTSILEAVFLCSTGRSHRTSKDTEMIQFLTDSLKVEIFLYRKDYGDVVIELEINAAGKKGVKINDIPIKKIGEMMGRLNVVMFSPEDIRIVKEEPMLRRKFLDMFISQIKPSYFYNVQQYIKILRQRNALLKQIRDDAKLTGTMDAWNAALSSTGARIIKERNHFIKRLDIYARDNHRLLTDEKDELNVVYTPSLKFDRDNDDEKIIEMKFNESLRKNAELDIIRLSTQTGPHRDDFAMFIGDKDIKNYGSQGQQRTCALALKMAQLDAMEAETGDMPVLLLDDVMSELDRDRQMNLSKNMKKAQTIITSTDSFAFTNEYDDNTGTRFFEVEGGRLL